MTENTNDKPRILIVDDASENLHAMMSILGDTYAVTAATSGEKALELAARIPQPDLVLLDIGMPEMDGYEVCKHLNEYPLTSKIPVIFVTVNNEEIDEELGLSLGAVDYITKPFSVPITLARIRNHIRLKQQADQLEAVSLIDALTHIPNRRRFDEVKVAEWVRAVREKKPLSTLMIDIDHFKEYNDHYSHGAGDTCLQSVAAALLAGVSRPGDLVARYGGEEFVAILPDTDEAAAFHIATRLCKVVRDLKLPHAHSDVEPVVTVSIGCATTIPSAETSTFNALIDEADKMLYKAKSTGRNRACGTWMSGENGENATL